MTYEEEMQAAEACVQTLMAYPCTEDQDFFRLCVLAIVHSNLAVAESEGRQRGG